MKTSTTILFLLVAIALGAYVFFVDREKPGTLQLSLEPPINFPVEEANLITLTRAGETISLRKRDHRWFLSRPVQDRADQDACRKFLEDLSNISIRETILASEFKKDSLSLSDLRLGPEEGIIVNILGSAAPPTLASLSVGNTGAFENTSYVTFPKDPNFPHVYLIDNDLNEFAGRILTALRDPKIVPFAPNEVGRLRMRDGLSEIEMFYDASSGLWKLARPLQCRANLDAVQDFIRQLSALDVVAFVDPADAPPSSDFDARNISVWHIDPQTGAVPSPDSPPAVTLEIALQPPADDTEEPRVLTRISDRDVILQAPDKLTELLHTPALSLRDPFLASIPEKAVRGIIIRSVDNPDILLSHNGQRWMSLRNGEWEAADPASVDHLIRGINREKVIRYFDDLSPETNDFGLDPPAVRIGLTTSSVGAGPGDPQPSSPDPASLEDPNALSYVLGLGNAVVPSGEPTGDETTAEETTAEETAVPDQIYARLADDPFVVSIDTSFRSKVPLHPLKWKNRAVLNFNVVSLRDIRIRRHGDDTPETHLVYDYLTNGWKLTLGETDLTPEIDPAKARALAETLGSLSALDWLTNREPAYRALENPSVTVDITLAYLGEDGIEETQKTTTLTFAPTVVPAPATPGESNEVERHVRSRLYFARRDDSLEVFLVSAKTLHSILTPLTP